MLTWKHSDTTEASNLPNSCKRHVELAVIPSVMLLQQGVCQQVLFQHRTLQANTALICVGH